MQSGKEYNYIYEDGKIVRATEYDIVINEEEFIIGKTVVNTVNYSYNFEGKLSRKRFLPADGRIVTSHSKSDSFGRKVFDELQFGTGFASRQFSYHLEQKQLSQMQ